MNGLHYRRLREDWLRGVRSTHAAPLMHVLPERDMKGTGVLPDNSAERLTSLLVLIPLSL